MNIPRFLQTISASLAFIMSAGASSSAEQNAQPAPKDAPAHVSFEFRVVRIPDAVARKLPVLNLQQPSPENAEPGGKLKFGVPTNVIGAQRYEQFLKAMEDSDAVKLIAAPRLTAPLKQKGTIESGHEFRYPTEWSAPAEPSQKWAPKTFGTRKLGLSVEAEAQENEDNSLQVEVAARAVALIGFVDRTTKKPLLDWKADRAGSALGWADDAPIASPDLARPVFEAQRAATQVKIRSGQTVLLILSSAEETAPFASAYAGQTLVALVSVKRIPPPGTAENSPEQPAAPAPKPDDGIPFAIPVEGKPGFVRSPFTPNAGFIDVRGFITGTEVRDPYGAGKSFRVP